MLKFSMFVHMYHNFVNIVYFTIVFDVNLLYIYNILT